MDLHVPQPYPLLKHGLLNTFPSLQKDIHTDVAIIGAGITGALVAWQLVQQGIQCTLLDKRHAATGSTAASTSLIQYELDTPLYQLQKLVGKENAVKSYKLCLDAINWLEQLTYALGINDHFTRKCSLQYASYQKHLKGLETEFELRKKYGFDVAWLTEKDIQNKFGFSKSGAILNFDAAQLDAYFLAHTIFKKIQKDCPIYDHTEVTQIIHERNGVVLITKDGFKVHAKKLVIASGYEAQQYIPKKIEDLHCTYVILSEPMDSTELWYENCHIWETAYPYLYIRTTTDENRILVGGKDTGYFPEAKQKQLLPIKAKALQKAFSKLFPQLNFKTDFSWSGAFGTSKDGLPYIGNIPQRPHTYFALGFGGNGITFSAIAAQFICNSICGQQQNDAQIFSFDR